MKLQSERRPQIWSGQAWEGCFAIALLVTVLAALVPFSPQLPLAGLDPSWSFAMNQAVAQHLVFGKDIIFTFGPYASIYTWDFHPATDRLMLWGSLYLGCFYALAAYLNFRRSRWFLQLALMIVFGGLIWSRDALLFFYPLLAGVFLARCLAQARAGAGTVSAGLLFLVFAPLGLLPLIKISATFASLGVMAVSAMVLMWNRMWAASLVILLSPILSALLFWSLAGQPPDALPQYFRASADIVSGFAASMSITGSSAEIAAYLIAAGMLIALILRERQWDMQSRAVLCFLFAIILFLSFKASFVRHDNHALTAATTLLLAALLVGTLSRRGTASFILPSVMAVAILFGASREALDPAALLGRFKATYAGGWNGLSQRLMDPQQLRRAFADRITRLDARGIVPPLQGTADVYPYDQTYLFASGNSWSPRPVLQSYQPYTPQLARQNLAHLLGKNRPDNLIFRLKPADGRLPSLEDGPSWPAILANYAPVSTSKGFLILSRKPAPDETFPAPRALSRNSYVLGEEIGLPQMNGLLFARLHIRLTWWGELANALFKPSQLAIRMRLANGEERRFRLIAGMAEAEFLLSPLIETANEFGLIYSGDPILGEKKVKSIAVEDEGWFGTWARQFDLELISLAYGGDAQYLSRFEYAKPESEAIAVSAIAGDCLGNMDPINGWATAPVSLGPQAALRVSGWLTKSPPAMDVPEHVYLSFRDEAGVRLFVKASRIADPDIANEFGILDLQTAGFTAAVDITGLKGHYVMELGYLENGALLLCPQAAYPLRIDRDPQR